MKQTKHILTTIAMLLCSLAASAHDFEVNGIYYNITSSTNKTVEVTYRGFNTNSYSGSITIPSTVTYGTTYNVTSIGASAFSDCSSLTSITIPESVTSIGAYAFSGCSSLTAITIPESVTSIGESAFRGCSSLTSITIPESVTSIGNYAFYDCSSLTDITIPEGVTSIGSSAFSGCSSLTAITIPEGVTSIGTYAFCDCRSLTDITIPEGVTSIGEGAFYDCKKLTSINIPESVTSIGESAFEGCSSLTTITLPKSVRSIYNKAFANCPELTDVYCYAETVPGTEADAFNGSYIEYATLHVPVGAIIGYYKTTAPWSSFGTIKTIENVTLEKCATPVISYVDGKVVFACDTEEAIVKSSFKDNSASDYNNMEVAFIPTYTITAYATKANYEDSDEVTLTLCWVPCTEEHEDDDTDGIITLPAKPVLIQTAGGVITLTGLPDGAEVAVYDTAGTSLAAATAENGTATLTTNLTTGSTAIVKIGGHSVKVVVK